MCFPPRESQTRIKHEILYAFAGAWAGIITTGLSNIRRLRGGASRTPHLVYLDAFAGPGCYNGEADGSSVDPVWGSPIIGMRAIELTARACANEGLKIQVTGIAIEENPAHYTELLSNLNRAQLSLPIRPSKRFEGFPAFGSFSVINGDATSHIDDVLMQLGKSAYLLAFLDPYGPSIKLETAMRVVGRRKTDCIIFFPTADVVKKGSTAHKPGAALTSADQGNLTRLNNLFGGECWRRIATDYSLTTTERERAYVELYRTLIQKAIPDGVVKDIGLEFSKTEATGYNLILTTRDADGALKMNEVLRKAEFKKHWTMWRDWEARLTAKAESVSGLTLDLGVPQRSEPRVELRKPANADVDAEVKGVLRPGETVELKQLLERLANSVLTRAEILGSLKRFKKSGVIEWDGSQSKAARINVGVPA